MLFTSESIKARVRQEPFVPFQIVTSAGEQYDVHHPELILVGAREVTVGSTSKLGAIAYEHLNRIALMHITAIKDIPSIVSGSKNGAT
jgi:hypothetical protein